MRDRRRKVDVAVIFFGEGLEGMVTESLGGVTGGVGSEEGTWQECEEEGWCERGDMKANCRVGVVGLGFGDYTLVVGLVGGGGRSGGFAVGDSCGCGSMRGLRVHVCYRDICARIYTSSDNIAMP